MQTEKNMSKKNNLPATEGQIGKKKRWTKKKIIIVSIIGVVVLAAIIGAVAILSTAVLPIRSTKEELKVVGTVGEYEVKYEELRFLTLLCRAELDSELGEYDTLDESGKKQYEELLYARVTDDIKQNYVIFSLCDKYGIKTDSIAMRSYVDDEMKEYVNTYFDGNMSKYKEWLSESGATDSIIRTNFKIDYLEEQLLDHYAENNIDIQYNEDNIEEFIQYVMTGEDWIRTIHVYYPEKHPFETDPENLPAGFDPSSIIAAYNGKDSIDKVKTEVGAIQGDSARLKAFKTAIGNAPGTNYSTEGNGFYFTYGLMGEEYEDIAYSLGAYQISDVFEYLDGYCIIMRIPLEESHVRLNALDLLGKYQYVVLNNHMAEESASLSFVGNDYYNGISLIDIE